MIGSWPVVTPSYLLFLKFRHCFYSLEFELHFVYVISLL
jgi:hypothetical protein